MGYAVYRYEEVWIIDCVWNVVKRRNDYMINYGGPVWVGEDELSRIVMVISA